MNLKPCANPNCQRPYSPLRKGRCCRCYQYWKANGREHPGSLLKCQCGQCLTCRSRNNARRQRSGIVYTDRASGRYQESKLILPIDTASLAYIAGIMDGEGCITSQNKSWRIQIAMTDKPLIEWLGTFGGSVSQRKQYGPRRPCWRWLLMRQAEVIEFLSALFPYLRVKRSEAEHAIREIAERDARRFDPRSEKIGG